MANDPKREAELAIHRLKARKEMRSADLDEDSAVITQKAHSKVHSSSPPSGFGKVRGVLELLPPWGRVIVVLALIAALAGSGLAAHFANWF